MELTNNPNMSPKSTPSTGLAANRTACNRDSSTIEAAPLKSDDDSHNSGWKRPDVFTSSFAEAAFCLSILSSVLIIEYLSTGFALILPALSTAFSIPPASQTWAASAFALTAGSFLLPFARLADLRGGYAVFNGGLGWCAVWALAGGFAPDWRAVVACRALQGLGAAAVLPASVALLARAYDRPGRRKNVVFGAYGACAPLGFLLGIALAGCAAQLGDWRRYNWAGAAIAAAVFGAGLVAVPRRWDGPEHMAKSGVLERGEMNHSPQVTPPPSEQKSGMDWLGVFTIVSGLILTVFGLTEASNSELGFRTPYVGVTLGLGVVFLILAFYVEGWVSTCPLLPFDLFKTRMIRPLCLALFLGYGVFGIFLFYTSEYIQFVLKASPLTTVAYFLPNAIGGVFFSTFGGFILHRISGRVLLVAAGLGHLACTLLMALRPDGQGYWAFIFPAMIASTIGIDVMYTVTNVFLTTEISTDRQGTAGALIFSLLYLGYAFWLGVAGLAVKAASSHGLLASYRLAFSIGVAVSVPVILLFLFIRIGSASSLVQDQLQGEEQIVRGEQMLTETANLKMDCPRVANYNQSCPV